VKIKELFVLAFMRRSYFAHHKPHNTVNETRMPTEDQPVFRDNGMRLWNLVADENAIITSNDLSPSLRLRHSVTQRVGSFQNNTNNTTSAPLPYQRQRYPTLLITPPPGDAHLSSHPSSDFLSSNPSSPSNSSSLSNPSSNSSSNSSTPRRVALQALVHRQDNELNILRQELRREETQHRHARCELSSYKQLVHDFCVLQVRTHRHAPR